MDSLFAQGDEGIYPTRKKKPVGANNKRRIKVQKKNIRRETNRKFFGLKKEKMNKLFPSKTQFKSVHFSFYTFTFSGRKWIMFCLFPQNL